jgi:hypothetical protein
MGPRYAGYPGEPVEGASNMDENPDADPYPERLTQVRKEQGEGPEALLLRPGEALRWRGARKPEVLSTPGFEWPFGNWREAAPQPRKASRSRQRKTR